MRSTHSRGKGVVSRQRSPWAEARRPEIPGLPHVAEVDLGVKTAEGPIKSLNLTLVCPKGSPGNFLKEVTSSAGRYWIV